MSWLLYYYPHILSVASFIVTSLTFTLITFLFHQTEQMVA